MTVAADIARALGCRKSTGINFLVKCVSHDDSDPSLSLKDGDDGKLLVTCFAGCDRLDILAELRRRGLLDDGRDHRRRHDRPAPRPRPAKPSAQTIDGVELPDAETLQKIARTIDRSKPLKGNLGARWLRDIRDLEPDLLDEEAVRFLPGSDRFPPSILSVISAWRDASIILGAQITALSSDGTEKLWRKFMRGGKPSGGVCRLVHDAEVTYELTLGEGLETCLAAMTAQHRAGHMVRPAWAALTAGNLGTLGPLAGIQRLMLLVDADAAGRKGAAACAELWHHTGREVRMAAPSVRNDWNDAT
ncbi:MAG: toprim domain-containing protein [Reyranellaceae bacterium]